MGGQFSNVNNNGTVLGAADYIAKWDGADWSALGSNGAGNGAIPSSSLSQVQAIAIAGYTDTLYAGGNFFNVNNNGVVLPYGDYMAAYGIALPPLVLSVTRANPSPTSAASVDFTITFSESVTGVDAADFTLTTTGVSGASVTGVTPVSGSTYTVTVNTGSGDGTIRLDVLDDDSIVDGASNPLGGSYSGGEVYTIFRLTFTDTLAAPVLRSPRNRMVSNNALPILRWTSVRGGLTYEIEIAADSGFTNIAANGIQNGTSYTVASPFGDNLYYWRVRAYNGSFQFGSWSSPRSFTIDTTGPASPVLTSPAVGASVRTATFRWSLVPTAVAYEFQVDDEAGFTNPVIISSIVRSNSRRLPVMPAGTYHWRVRARDMAGNWGPWTVPFTVNFTGP